MAGSDFDYSRRRIPRRGSVMRPRNGVRSYLWLAPVMAIAFLVTLATFHRFPDGISIDWKPGLFAADIIAAEAASADDILSARFGLCDGGGRGNCVVDGDTFWFAGDKYRIADIDAPETHPARCTDEAALGEAATARLREWLNDGAFSLEGVGPDTDRYDRKLRIVTRGGTSVGSVLVAEGLARPWEGRRRPWC